MRQIHKLFGKVRRLIPHPGRFSDESGHWGRRENFDVWNNNRNRSCISTEKWKNILDPFSIAHKLTRFHIFLTSDLLQRDQNLSSFFNLQLLGLFCCLSKPNLILLKTIFKN